MASTWKGQLSFGLVVFPVRLYPAARRERVRLSYLRQRPAAVEEVEPAGSEPEPPQKADGRRLALVPPQAPQAAEAPAERAPSVVSRVKQELTAGDDEQPVSRGDLLRGVEVAPEQYVTFTNEELKSLRVQTSPDLQILRSVDLKDIDPVYFETSYFVAPEPAGMKAYALLYAALQRTQRVAIGKLSMHGREHVIVVRPGQSGLLAHSLFYNNEIRRQHETAANVESLGPKEVDLAVAVIEAIAEPFAPEEFTDQHKTKLETLITAKAHRQETLPTASPTAAVLAPAADIMAALQSSLKSLKKPPTPDTSVTPTAGTEKPKAAKRAKKKA
jgi:DNA end-binding protein Ku